MNILSLIGALVITLSFLSYGIGSITLQRFKVLSPGILVFITIGVLLDIVAIAFMIAGAGKIKFSLHSILGFTATFTMMVNLLLVLRLYEQKGMRAGISRSLFNFSRIAYFWWVIAYLTGSLLVLW